MTIIINGAHKLTNVVYIPSNPKGSCARIILENKDGILIESIVLPYSSKNQIESKAFLVVLRIVDDMGAKEIKIYINSQLVAFAGSGRIPSQRRMFLRILSTRERKNS
jgi:ribonuclease HI